MHSAYTLQSPILPHIVKISSAVYTYFSQKSGYHISITIYTAATAHITPYHSAISNKLVSQALYSFPKLPERLVGVDAVGHITPCMA